MGTAQTKSKVLKWISYTLQGLIAIMFLMGAVMNIIGSEDTIKQSMDMGYPESSLLYLGLVLLVSTVLYLIPKTTIVGAALLTAWLGGAVATHVIHGDPLGNTLFPVVFGVLVWLAIWLRSAEIKRFFPFVVD